MTECSVEVTLFPLRKEFSRRTVGKPSRQRVGKPSRQRAGKPVVVRNDGGAVTSDAGVLLLQEIDERLGLTRRLAGCIRDERQPGKVEHTVLGMVRQRVYQIACGYEDCNDADWMRQDPALKLALGRAPSEADLASQPTLSRLENAVSARECWLISIALVDAYIVRHRKAPPRRIIIDADATDDETHGKQQLSFFHGYYDHYCYLPLLVFAQAEGRGEQELIGAMLRPGNKHAGHRAMSMVRVLVKRLRAAFPKCRLQLRADSGLALPEVYDGCDQLGLPYLISLPKNHRLVRMVEAWMARARATHAETAEKVRLFGEFTYAAHSWDRQRRVIAKAEVTSQGDNPRFVVTSLQGGDPQDIYRCYCQRGDPENRIKELKGDLKADRLSCHRFWANQFRLLLHAAAYVLMQQMRSLLHTTQLARAQVGTLRLRLLKVGARITESVRRVLVQLPSAYGWAQLWPRLARAAPN